MSRDLQTLRDAREVLADPARWTKEASARTRHGVSVRGWDPDAVCWCAYGACERTYGVSVDGATEYLKRAAIDLFDDFVSSVNDTLGHAAVLRMYDRAIQLAEAEG